MQHAISHPHALAAVQLAEIDRPKRTHINLVLRETGMPRSLYTLARVLRAAQLAEMARINAEIDAVNFSHPAVLRKAA